MRIGVIAISRGGWQLAEKIVDRFHGATLLPNKTTTKTAEIIAANWSHYDGFICIMATGIAVRAIAPLLQDKLLDPCIVVMDEKGRHAISLLAGHVGGANALAHRIAALTGGIPVITTASDTLNLAALDLWAEDQQLVPPGRSRLTALSATLVNRGKLSLYADVDIISLPRGLVSVTKAADADIIVSNRINFHISSAIFIPKNLVVGVGCNRNTPVDEFEDALEQLFGDLHLNRQSIRNLASIDKKNNEQGLLQFASHNQWKIDFFDNNTINTLKDLEISFAALKSVGAIGVAEPTSLLSAKTNLLINRKRKWENITMAVAQVPFSLSVPAPDQQNS